VQSHPLAGSHLSEDVDVVVGHYADDRIATGDGMVGTQDYW
jgi:hypothetical protein